VQGGIKSVSGKRANRQKRYDKICKKGTYGHLSLESVKRQVIVNMFKNGKCVVRRYHVMERFATDS